MENLLTELSNGIGLKFWFVLPGMILTHAFYRSRCLKYDKFFLAYAVTLNFVPYLIYAVLLRISASTGFYSLVCAHAVEWHIARAFNPDPSKLAFFHLMAGDFSYFNPFEATRVTGLSLLMVPLYLWFLRCFFPTIKTGPGKVAEA